MEHNSNIIPDRKGLVIVNTGDGKGKTTAALGIILRSWGRNFRICMIQFIKPETSITGEYLAAKKMAIEWHRCGDGFTWLSKGQDESISLARNGWQLAQEKISSGVYDLMVLDEFTYPLHFSWLDPNEVVDWLKTNKPSYMHLMITGRNAPQQIIDYADLVTEMRLVKHPFSQGVKGQSGVEF
ncbi:MAG: cob(I)yrinic acid a,c-diamide adenosyltransferase [Anaerolineaceae bacterium]